MAAQGPSALPPTIVHSSKSISQSAAHDFLTAYLDRAANDPALQPNASISEHGPVSRTTAAAPNLILHNLKRVQAGLAGDNLGQDLTVAKQNPNESYLDVAAGAALEGNEEVEDDEQDHDMEEFQAEAEAFQDQELSQADVDKEDRKKKKKERRLAEKKARATKAE